MSAKINREYITLVLIISFVVFLFPKTHDDKYDVIQNIGINAPYCMLKNISYEKAQCTVYGHVDYNPVICFTKGYFRHTGCFDNHSCQVARHGEQKICNN